MGGAGIVQFIVYVYYYWIRSLKKIMTRHNSIEKRCVSSLSLYLCHHNCVLYRIRRNIGESNIWRNTTQSHFGGLNHRLYTPYGYETRKRPCTFVMEATVSMQVSRF